MFPSSSSAEWNKLLAKHVEAASKISDEEEAEAVWKEILARKGLPLDTPYEYVDTSDKAYDESYCDRLFLTIREKEKNPEAAKSWGDSAFEWLPAPASPPKATSSKFFRLTFDERNPQKKKKKSINRLIYEDDVSEQKRIDYLLKQRQESIDWFKEREAKFGPGADNLFSH